MATFENYVFNNLSSSLNTSLKTVVSDNSISLNLKDSTDLNKFQRLSNFTAVVRFSKKIEAAEVSDAFQKALYDLKLKNYINSVSVDYEGANRDGLPTYWEYTVIFRILHRRRSSW